MAYALGRPNTLRAGPWSGVWNTTDPFDSQKNKLIDARNIYIPDPENGSGVYARPGFVLANNGAAVSSGKRGQAIYTHFDVDGNATNFCVLAGKLYRVDPTLSMFTDVTPVGVTIDNGATTRVYMASMGGVMAVTDGVNRPWYASNLSATPITGTYIDFDGMGTAWVAFGPPRVWGGSGFWVLTSYNSVGARLDIAWSEPNDWTAGYQQTDFDNRWTLEQTGTDPIYALAGTNVALNYWRQRSIGAISGTVGPDLATTATHDAVSTNVGTQAPQTIIQFGDAIFFCDVIGRPYHFTPGSAPKPIWHQLRTLIDSSAAQYPLVSAITATAAFEPTLNLYCVAIWSPRPGSQAAPVEWQCFDAATGLYMGRWSIGPTAIGVSVDCMGTFLDGFGRGTLVVLGSATSGGATGYCWSMNSLSGTPDLLATEDLVVLTTEDGVELTIEGQPAVWTDDGEIPLRNIKTDRMGYAEDIIWLYDQATVLTGNESPISIELQTPNDLGTVEATPTPINSDDGIYRSVCGLDLQGRGAQVTVTPTTADDQWSVHRCDLIGVPSLAGVDDA